MTAGTHGRQITGQIKIHLRQLSCIRQALEGAVTHATTRLPKLALLVDLVMRIQTNIRLCIMTLVTDGTAGVIRPTTKKVGIELLLRFFTQALLGQIMTGNATELALRALDGAAKLTTFV